MRRAKVAAPDREATSASALRSTSAASSPSYSTRFTAPRDPSSSGEPSAAPISLQSGSCRASPSTTSSIVSIAAGLVAPNGTAAATASSKLACPTKTVRRDVGRGTIESSASTTTPSVPSAPVTSAARSRSPVRGSNALGSV
ncbi:MAG: hypothetical protein FJ257_11935 [Phycisphaerae bacterium]|nr:hypothetical protein [Phycisphaerae bacterium]